MADMRERPASAGHINQHANRVPHTRQPGPSADEWDWEWDDEDVMVALVRG